MTTTRGDIIAEHVVNAAGLWAREVPLAGVYLPLHPMEHQYLVTDDLAEIYELPEEPPLVLDPAGETYLRPEGRGLLIGFYEQACEPWAVKARLPISAPNFCPTAWTGSRRPWSRPLDGFRF